MTHMSGPPACFLDGVRQVQDLWDDWNVGQWQSTKMVTYSRKVPRAKYSWWGGLYQPASSLQRLSLMFVQRNAAWLSLACLVSFLLGCAEGSMHMRTPLGARDDGHMDILSRIHAKHHVGEHEGEHHGTPNVPSGSQLLTLPVGNSGEKIAAYWSLNVNNQKVEHAFIMMHGRYRNGDHYWTIMNDAVESARKSNAFSSSKEVVVVAPEMYSTKLNKGQYDNETLAWGGGNAWIAGAIATHPKGTNLTSMDALDAFLDHFSDKSEFPNLKNITLVGHGGGGQLMNRYAATGKDVTNKDIYVRYIVGDPSSSAYFTYHRPVTNTAIADINDCNGYNTWRYGFHEFPGTLDSKVTPQDYFGRYLSRDVVNIIGLQDVDTNHGDQSCMAVLQGGHKRRDRNLSWWRYINLLSRTGANLAGFPGNFSDLPDWSSAMSEGKINTRLAIVEDASHNAAKIFSSKVGRSALFNDYEVEMGWRPEEWHKNQKHYEKRG